MCEIYHKDGNGPARICGYADWRFEGFISGKVNSRKYIGYFLNCNFIFEDKFTYFLIIIKKTDLRVYMIFTLMHVFVSIKF